MLQANSFDITINKNISHRTFYLLIITKWKKNKLHLFLLLLYSINIFYFSIIIRLNTKSPNTNCIRTHAGGEDATRTHNALRHTTFPMWLLTIRIPLRVALDYYSKHFSKKQEGNFNFLKNFFAPAKRGRRRASYPVRLGRKVTLWRGFSVKSM